MLPGVWTTGWVWASLGLISLAIMGYAASRKLFCQPRGWPRILGTAIIAWTWMTAGTQFLGITGYLFRSTLIAWSVGGAVLALLVPCRRTEQNGARDELDASSWDWAATISLGVILGASFEYGTNSLLLPPKIVSDGPIYHLFFAARWWKEGRLFLIAFPFGENAATYFPAGGDLWLSWLMTVFGGDRLARVGQAPFFGLAVLSVLAIARQLGAGRSAAVVASAWFASSLPLFIFSFEANVDDLFIAGYLSACYFGLRFALDGELGTLALAGLAAGGAWGSKPAATTFLPPLLAIGGLIVLFRPRTTRRERVWGLLILCLTPLIMAGFWYVRNACLTGNPLYPLRLTVPGRTVLAGWYDLSAMQQSQFYISVTDWRAMLDILFQLMDARLAPFWFAALAGGWAIGCKRYPFDRWIWAFAMLAVSNFALFWLVIPYRTQQRFALHALGLAAVPLAMLFNRSGWLRLLGSSLLIVHMMTHESWPFGRGGDMPIWRFSQSFPRGSSALIDISQRPTGFGFVFAGLGVAYLWGWASRRGSRSSQAYAIAVTIACTLAGPAIFDRASSAARNGELTRSAFPNLREYQAGWRALDRLCPPGGAHIAYAGTNLPYFLMGSGLRNDVRYVNIDAHPDWQMHNYHQTARLRGEPDVWDTPIPGWDRIRPDYDAWLANLRAERIDFLVVARANPNDAPFNVADATGFPIERKWAADHPEAFAPVYGVRPADPQFRVYRVLPVPRRSE